MPRQIVDGEHAQLVGRTPGLRLLLLVGRHHVRVAIDLAADARQHLQLLRLLLRQHRVERAHLLEHVLRPLGRVLRLHRVRRPRRPARACRRGARRCCRCSRRRRRPCRAAPSSSTASATASSSVRSLSKFHSSGSAHFDQRHRRRAHGDERGQRQHARASFAASSPSHDERDAPQVAPRREHARPAPLAEDDHRRHQHEGHEPDQQHAGAAEQAELVEAAERGEQQAAVGDARRRHGGKDAGQRRWSSPSPAPGPPACRACRSSP